VRGWPGSRSQFADWELLRFGFGHKEVTCRHPIRPRMSQPQEFHPSFDELWEGRGDTIGS